MTCEGAIFSIFLFIDWKLLIQYQCYVIYTLLRRLSVSHIQDYWKALHLRVSWSVHFDPIYLPSIFSLKYFKILNPSSSKIKVSVWQCFLGTCSTNKYPVLLFKYSLSTLAPAPPSTQFPPWLFHWAGAACRQGRTACRNTPNIRRLSGQKNTHFLLVMKVLLCFLKFYFLLPPHHSHFMLHPPARPQPTQIRPFLP